MPTRKNEHPVSGGEHHTTSDVTSRTDLRTSVLRSIMYTRITYMIRPGINLFCQYSAHLCMYCCMFGCMYSYIARSTCDPRWVTYVRKIPHMHVYGRVEDTAAAERGGGHIRVAALITTPEIGSMKTLTLHLTFHWNIPHSTLNTQRYHLYV